MAFHVGDTKGPRTALDSPPDATHEPVSDRFQTHNEKVRKDIVDSESAPGHGCVVGYCTTRGGRSILARAGVGEATRPALLSEPSDVPH